MPKVKSFSVGNGDMFYIKHGSENFTIIDCHLDIENKERIIKEIKTESKEKEITRFISTHPDEDHILGIKTLDENMGIVNFYCTKNEAKKEDETESFKHYCNLRDNQAKAYYVYKNCKRKWMNLSSDNEDNNNIGCSGINILWPDTSNEDYKNELACCSNYGNANNISPIIKYSIENGATFLWFGDLETDYIEKVSDKIDWVEADVIFAPHHGRISGALPNDILKKINPKIIVVGEADSKDLEYYKEYNTITQNSSGDIIFECDGSEIDVYCSNENYSVSYLENKRKNKYDNYIGTLTIKKAVTV